LWLDNGQHVFLRCCTAYRALLARLGSEPDTILQPRLEIPVLSPGGEVSWLRRSRAPAPLHLGGALARYRHLSPRQRAAAARAPLSAVHGWPAERTLQEAGVEVRLGWRAQRVAAARGRLEVEAANGDGLEADAVVVAVPHQRVAGLLPDGAIPAPQRLAALG